MTTHEWPELTDDNRTIWNANAGYWDDTMGEESNDFHRLLVCPATERLLNIQPGARVLEIACGNGNFARRLAELGAQVTATDASAVMIERAGQRTTTYAEQIDYRVLDATDLGALLALGIERFDAAVANMALMDIPVITPLITALCQLLKPGGVFVFSVIHPCFQSPNMVKLVEESDYDGNFVQQPAIKVTRYLTPAASKGLALLNQPVPQYYFHRSFSTLFSAFFAQGFVLDGLEEPSFPPERRSPDPLSWRNFNEIPPLVVARMRSG
jgi:2-polyprenyl-3-methyl-5-hydroxy-6-metoxy-1,4-benzoquinol methylase